MVDSITPDMEKDDLSLIATSEDQMEAAIVAILASGLTAKGKPILSCRKVAKMYQVDWTTLQHHCNGGLTCTKAHEDQMLISVGFELALKEWIKAIGYRGIPITTPLFLEKISELCGITPRVNFIYRFKAHHPDLKVKQGKALNRSNIGGFFDLLEGIQAQYNIPPENIFNMDEKGVQLGIGNGHQRVLIDRDQKDVNALTNGNKEMVTVLETVCADGSADIPPYYIYQEVKIQRACIGVSESGWSDSQHAINWIIKVFGPHSKRHNKSGNYQLLIIDGHQSHCTIEFVCFAKNEWIIIICLPPHCTHAMQLEDVRVFGPLEVYWKQEVTARARHRVAITKEFAMVYA
ncbi:hypothetical protein FRB93_010964 [Tulasnella sp. JGI-2019a]|nr:hypothetical protein FRB93_010964 [Tulasnella sp. JGI-2019a]